MFAERLKLLRKSNPNLTQQDMANILGVAKTTYASYEQGKRTPDAELQNKIADYFDVSLDYLHGRDVINNSNLDKNMNRNNELSPEQLTVAAHIDDDVSEEEMKEILSFIDYIKKRDHYK